MPADSDPRLAELLADSHDELWVIERGPGFRSQPDAPRCGTLYYAAPNPLTGESSRAMLPIERTSVTADIAGFVSSVELTQTFTNLSNVPIEAVYAFPLPENASISEFVMTIGRRSIRGIIREREEASRIYHSAKDAGLNASLLTQERPNIFTQRVANIEPGRPIEISIRYFGTLGFDDGRFEFVVPVGIGDRYMPPETPRKLDSAAPTPRHQQLDITVNLDAGFAIRNIESPSHAIDAVRPSDTTASVRLAGPSVRSDQDFVLHWQAAGKGVQSALLVGPSRAGSAPFTLLIVPPRSATREDRSPLDIVYVLDRSGSMAGAPLDQAVKAIREGLAGMDSDEHFQIVDFSDSAGGLGSRMLPANRSNIASAERYLAGLSAGGGTQMLRGLERALTLPAEKYHRKVVAFLTDGFIGNEVDVLNRLDQHLHGATVFSFGVGAKPNRFLMNEMAIAGHGAATYTASGGDMDDRMNAFLEAARRPALTNVKLDFLSAGNVSDVYPSRMPEMFAGRPVVIVGRVAGELKRPIVVSGLSTGKYVSWEVGPRQIAWPAAGVALEQIWARAKIADIGRRGMRGAYDGDAVGDIRRTALDFGLVSPFTSFVAVDALSPPVERGNDQVHE